MKIRKNINNKKSINFLKKKWMEITLKKKKIILFL